MVRRGLHEKPFVRLTEIFSRFKTFAVFVYCSRVLLCRNGCVAHAEAYPRDLKLIGVTIFIDLACRCEIFPCEFCILERVDGFKSISTCSGCRVELGLVTSSSAASFSLPSSPSTLEEGSPALSSASSSTSSSVARGGRRAIRSWTCSQRRRMASPYVT